VRIAFLPDGSSVNTMYRSIAPMRALAERGHETRRLEPAERDSWPATLRWCDLLHIHRVCDEGVVEVARAARAAGASVVWDDDDDVTHVPKKVSSRKVPQGLESTRRRAARARLFRLVDLTTTPSRHLAERFLEGGAPAARVIENYVIDEAVTTPPAAGQGLEVGWVAGLEHRLDLERIPVTEVLAALLDEHPTLRVTTIGVRLDLASDRYRHIEKLPLPQALQRASRFAVGIAPLSPAWAMNLARSNVKLKEYAAVGVPWLASPIGPYVGLGESEGGRLVVDDAWRDELSALLDSPRRRRKLAKRAVRWGRRETVTRNAEQWERAFAWALEHRGATRAAPAPS